MTSHLRMPSVSGEGRWLILRFEPTSMFSLKMSSATSSVGRTLLVPTPYSVKMALVDSAFRSGWPGNVDALVRGLAQLDLRIAPPHSAVVTHTIVKIRQEPKDRKGADAYISAVAYREFVHQRGGLGFAFDTAGAGHDLTETICSLAPCVNYIGKRGGFIQFTGIARQNELGAEFTQPISNAIDIPLGCTIATLDDFGPEASLERLNSYSSEKVRRDKDRKFVETVIPLARTRVGPGFTEYLRE